MFVGSCAAFYSGAGRGQQGITLYAKKVAFPLIARKPRKGLIVRSCLELEAQPKLHSARRMRSGSVQEAIAAEAGVDRIKFRVIEDVKHFPTEFERCPFLNLEALERTKVKIH